jgi:hypothetical protein
VRPVVAGALPASRKQSINTSIEIGKYLISPLTKRLPDRQYAASVSIRSGTGTETSDRVVRLVPRFDNHDDAVDYAVEQGLAWLQAHEPNPSTQHWSEPWPRKI